MKRYFRGFRYRDDLIEVVWMNDDEIRIRISRFPSVLQLSRMQDLQN